MRPGGARQERIRIWRKWFPGGIAPFSPGSPTGVRSGELEALDLNWVSGLPDLGQIIVYLLPQPAFRTAPKGHGQTKRHFRRDPIMAMDQPGETIAGYAQSPGGFGNSQPQRLKALFVDHTARMR